MATERLCNRLLYGLEHNSDDDAAVDAVLVETGVAPEVVAAGHSLTFAQAKNAVRTGVLPSGALLQPELSGRVGRMVVISMHHHSGAADFLHVWQQQQFHPVSHLYDCARVPSDYVAAMSLRLVATSPAAFGLERTQIIERLTGGVKGTQGKGIRVCAA